MWPFRSHITGSALRTTVCLLAGLQGVTALAAAGEAPVPVLVGLRKQLVVDDSAIAEKHDVTRELGEATKANGGRPLVVADKPWEKPIFLLGSVLRDGDRLRMWYRFREGVLGYAESTDGLRWNKPTLGLVEFEGSKANNILNSGAGYIGMMCTLDPHETDPAHKYKTAYTHSTIRACIAHSADGLRWTPYNQGEPVTHRAADTFNQLLWDEDARVYRLYTRTDYQERLKAKIEVRGTRDMVNPDVKADARNWKIVREWAFDREPEEYKRRQIYALNGWLYEGVHFGLLWAYEWPEDLSEGPADLQKRHERDICNLYLVHTRGAEPWNLESVYAGKPLIPRGPDGSFDKDGVASAVNIVTWNDRHWIYYTGAKERHNTVGWENAAIGLATLRLDGFVFLQARGRPGTVLTRPFRLEGTGLEVNVDAKRGELSVEILDESGRAIPGFARDDARALRGVDDLRARPKWKGHEDLRALKGRVVRLRFLMTEARLYAFQVRP